MEAMTHGRRELPRWAVRALEVAAFAAILLALFAGSAAFTLSTESTEYGNGVPIQETLPTATGSGVAPDSEYVHAKGTSP